MTSKEPIFIKVVLIGDHNIGKTSIIKRYFEDSFDSDSSNITLSQDFKSKEIEIGDNILRIMILDTLGHERFKTIGTSFYRGVSGTILAFDITERVSFESCLERWYKESKLKSSVSSYGNQYFLIGTKLDLVEQNIKQRQVSFEEASLVASDLGIQYLETSSKYNINIDKLFSNFINQIHQNINIHSNNNNKNCIIN